MTERLELLSYEERLRELWLIILEEKLLKGDLQCIYKYLMGGVKKTEPDFSPWNQMIRGNEHKLKYRKILFKHKKKKKYCEGDWAPAPVS